jgi:hypothetical protein
VLERALSRFRDDRYQSAADFLRALEDYAIDARLMASQLRFGSFLTDHFAREIVDMRRARELSVRSVPSEVPPAMPEVMAALEKAVSAERPASGEYEPGLEVRPHERVWSEPGAISRPEPPLDSGKIMLQELGTDQEHVAPAPPARRATEVELDRSLAGLELLAEETQAQLRSGQTPTVPSAMAVSVAPGSASREWVWYAAAAAILAGSLAAYLLT